LRIGAQAHVPPMVWTESSPVTAPWARLPRRVGNGRGEEIKGNVAGLLAQEAWVRWTTPEWWGRITGLTGRVCGGELHAGPDDDEE